METNDKIQVFHHTLTEWDEFRKWCEDRRGPMFVARDLPLFVQLFRETQDRLRHQELLQALGLTAPPKLDGMLREHLSNASVDGARDGAASPDKLA